jgi:hypothetical protein
LLIISSPPFKIFLSLSSTTSLHSLTPSRFMQPPLGIEEHPVLCNEAKAAYLGLAELVELTLGVFSMQDGPLMAF